jgi:dTMP kinase
MDRYPFIVIEGLDGTGKTTLRKGLFRLYEGLCGVTPLCILTTNYLEPSVVPDLISGKYSPSADNRDRYAAAIVADKRASLRELVLPALPVRPVISDRWLLSELAFFAVKHGLPPEHAYDLLAPAIDVAPDVTLVLDLAPDHSMARAQSRSGDATRPDWDVLDVQTGVRAVYSEVILASSRYPLLGQVVPLMLEPKAERSAVLSQAWDALRERQLLP